jgi:hypothetical protein
MVMGLRHSLIERQSSQVDEHRTVSLWPNSWHKIKGILTATRPGIHPQNPRTGTIFTTLVKILNSPTRRRWRVVSTTSLQPERRMLCRQRSYPMCWLERDYLGKEVR